MTALDAFRLDGKVAVVTGASSGLGAAIAVALAEAGADLVLGARRADRLAETVAAVEATGHRAIAVATDVVDPAQCEALVTAGVEAFTGVDILVNCAGLGTAVPATRETPEEFRQVFDVNLFGAYWCAQAFARVARPGGAIVNVSSVLGMTASPAPQAAYSASKSAMIGLTRDLAMQWTSRKGIRVNTLSPGFVPTEMSDEYPPGFVDTIVATTAAKRTGTPQELATACLFLVSPAAAYVTGANLVVDGGLVFP